jgi:choline dehydrogenase-like flavoprotein
VTVGLRHATVIGSGPSAASAALALLERGVDVEMIDIGITEPAPPAPEAGLVALKTELADPFSYFLGDDYQAVLFPPSRDLYSLPPNRRYLATTNTAATSWIPGNFRALISHAEGGFGIGWGANCLEFDDRDLRGFPISRAELEPSYRAVGARVGISGVAGDALAPFLPNAVPLQPPLPLNEHEQHFLRRAQEAQQALRESSAYVGRSRLAVITQPGAEREACALCDRCIWGCARGSIYDTRQTLRQCRRFAGFRYYSGWAVTHFEVAEGQLVAAHAIQMETRESKRFPLSTCFLGAGALASAAILLRTLRHDAGKGEPAGGWTTPSIVDTPVIRIPYVMPSMIGHASPTSNFQFNRLALGFDNSGERLDYVHGEVVTFSGLLAHPVINGLPFGSGISRRIFARVRAALGAITLFLPDAPNPGNRISLERDESAATGDRARITYEVTREVASLASQLTRRARALLHEVGCFAPPRASSVYTPGSGIHYGGTIPMTSAATTVGVDRMCRSHAYQNLFVVDGSTFPHVPSKSITFTLMANADRVARAAAAG